MTTTIRTDDYPNVVSALPSAAGPYALYVEMYDDTLAGRAVRVVNCTGSVDYGGPYAYGSGIGYIYLNTGVPVAVHPALPEGGYQLAFGVSPDGGEGYFSFELEIEDSQGSGVYIPFAAAAIAAMSDYSVNNAGEKISWDGGDGPNPPEPAGCFWTNLTNATQVCA